MNDKLQHIKIVEVPMWKGNKLLIRMLRGTSELGGSYTDIPVSYSRGKWLAYVSIKAIKGHNNCFWDVGSFTIDVRSEGCVKVESLLHHVSYNIPMAEFEGQMRILLRIINGTN